MSNPNYPPPSSGRYISNPIYPPPPPQGYPSAPPQPPYANAGYPPPPTYAGVYQYHDPSGGPVTGYSYPPQRPGYQGYFAPQNYPPPPQPPPYQVYHCEHECYDDHHDGCSSFLRGCVEEAKKKIYACSTTTYQGFQVEVSEEESEKFKSLPGVVFVLPDSYIDPVNKEYGGDKYVNGTIIPRPPPVQMYNMADKVEGITIEIESTTDHQQEANLNRIMHLEGRVITKEIEEARQITIKLKGEIPVLAGKLISLPAFWSLQSRRWRWKLQARAWRAIWSK